MRVRSTTRSARVLPLCASWSVWFYGMNVFFPSGDFAKYLFTVTKHTQTGSASYIYVVYRRHAESNMCIIRLATEFALNSIDNGSAPSSCCWPDVMATRLLFAAPLTLVYIISNNAPVAIKVRASTEIICRNAPGRARVCFPLYCRTAACIIICKIIR